VTKRLESKCGDHQVRGTKKQIVSRYERMAEEENDKLLKEKYLNCAEHYRKY